MFSRVISVFLLGGVLAVTAGSASRLVAQMPPSSSGVAVVDAGALILRDRRPFDLQGRSVRFKPHASGGYDVIAVDVEPFIEIGAPLSLMMASRGEFTASWRLALPFPFPAGGRVWTEAFANLSGTVSFGRSEVAAADDRNFWSDGTMRSMASALDAHAASGGEVVIAALWGVYGTQSTVWVDATAARLAVTWRAIRHVSVDSFHDPLGANVFRATLFPSGEVVLSFWEVAEQDGIVGLFTPRAAASPVLDAVEEPDDAPLALVDIRLAELRDHGTTIRATMTMGADVPARVESGMLAYRLFLDVRGRPCQLALVVDTSAQYGTSSCTAAPRTIGWRAAGRTVELTVSKTAFDGATRLSWSMDAVWFGAPGRFDQVFLQNPRPLQFAPYEIDLSAGALAGGGSAFEVFHYPVVPRNPADVTPAIYATRRANDDIAVLLTDFRIDDLTGGGPGTGGINVPISGIGGSFATPRSGSSYGSSQLQVSMATSFVGGRKFRRSVSGSFGEYPIGINWIVHETVHRWTAHLRWRRPDTGATQGLFGPDCQCHWSEWLHTPSHVNVGPEYSGASYVESSPMGGFAWEDGGDGTFLKRRRPLDNTPSGLSALDLYAMGMLAPEEVPPTFFLTNPQALGGDRFRATRLPVRIEDVIAVEGNRNPASHAAQRAFRATFYLLHEPRRAAHAALLQSTIEIAQGFARYMHLATGRRMTIVLGSSAGGPFHDSPLTPRVTPIRALHIEELRNRIDSLRVRFGRSPFNWTDAILAGGGIRAVHVSELRSAVGDVYLAAGQAPPLFSDPVLNTAVTARAVHIEEVRAAVVAME